MGEWKKKKRDRVRETERESKLERERERDERWGMETWQNAVTSSGYSHPWGPPLV